jgi:hypothetical protein
MRTLVRLVPAAALLLAGCGKGTDHAAHPVSGQVLYDGKPAAGVQVFFIPAAGGNAHGAPMNPHAVTGPDGGFAVSTFGAGDGAPEGGYIVVLLWPKESSEEESPPDQLFGWYDARHTTLTAKVAAGDNKLPPFELPAVKGPPPASEGIPGRN